PGLKSSGAPRLRPVAAGAPPFRQRRLSPLPPALPRRFLYRRPGFAELDPLSHRFLLIPFGSRSDDAVYREERPGAIQPRMGLQPGEFWILDFGLGTAAFQSKIQNLKSKIVRGVDSGFEGPGSNYRGSARHRTRRPRAPAASPPPARARRYRARWSAGP